MSIAINSPILRISNLSRPDRFKDWFEAYSVDVAYVVDVLGSEAFVAPDDPQATDLSNHEDSAWLISVVTSILETIGETGASVTLTSS